MKLDNHPQSRSKENHMKTFNALAVLVVILSATSAFAAGATPAPAKCGDAKVSEKIADLKDAVKSDVSLCNQGAVIKAEFVGLGCSDDKANAAVAAVCPEPAKKSASADTEGTIAFVMNWLLMHPVAEAFWYLKTYDGSHQFFTKGMFDQLDSLGYVKKGKNREAREYFENFATGATSDFELFLGLLDRNQIEKDYVEKFLAPNGCSQQPDKAWKCPDATLKLGAVNALLGKLKEADRPKAATYFCKGLKRNGKPLVKEDEILQYASVCFNSLPAGTIAFAQMGKVKSGRTLFEGAPNNDSAPKINDREVEICHQSGDCIVGTVKEVDKSKGIIVDVAEGDTRVVTPEDLLAKNYKVFVGMSTKSNDPNAISPDSIKGVDAVVTTPNGTELKGKGDVVDHGQKITVTLDRNVGLIGRETNTGITLGVGFGSFYQTGRNSLGVTGASLQAVLIQAGWKFNLHERLWVEPHAVGGVGFVTGYDPKNQGPTPDGMRVVGVGGGGVTVGTNVGIFSPYVVAQLFGAPGFGYSVGVGTLIRTESAGAFDASLRWTSLDTEVLSGFRASRVRLDGGLGFTLGWKF